MDNVGIAGIVRSEEDQHVVERVQEIFGTINDDRILAFQNRAEIKKAEDRTSALPRFAAFRFGGRKNRCC